MTTAREVSTNIISDDSNESDIQDLLITHQGAVSIFLCLEDLDRVSSETVV